MAGKERFNNSIIPQSKQTTAIKGTHFAYSCKQHDHSIQTVISVFVTAGDACMKHVYRR